MNFPIFELGKLEEHTIPTAPPPIPLPRDVAAQELHRRELSDQFLRLHDPARFAISKKIERAQAQIRLYQSACADLTHRVMRTRDHLAATAAGAVHIGPDLRQQLNALEAELRENREELCAAVEELSALHKERAIRVEADLAAAGIEL